MELFHCKSAVRSKAFSPKIKSSPEQFAKEYSMSTELSRRKILQINGWVSTTILKASRFVLQRITILVVKLKEL